MARRHHLRKIDESYDRLGLAVLQQFRRLRRSLRDVFPRTVHGMTLERAVGREMPLGAHRHARVTDVMLPGAPVLIVPGDGRLHSAQVDHEVKFVQVAVDQSVAGQSIREEGRLLKDGSGLLGRNAPGVDLIQRYAPDQSHGDHVAVVPQRSGRLIVHAEQSLHEGEFLQGRDATQEQPRVGLLLEGQSLLLVLRHGVHHEIVALLLHIPEGRPSQPVKFQYDLLPRGRRGDVHVRLFPRTDPISQRRDDPPRFQIVQRQNVVSRVGQSISVVSARSIVTEELVPQQGREDLVRPSVAQMGEGRDQRRRH
mmetsp:Transcript_50290/g.151395  ORF Transcript_50290/g.151395 Transcript_50290/m.151395 type:complete len:310 (+) Transcript_50290:1371-2300(+)